MTNIIIFIFIFGLITGCGIGICYFLVSRFKKIKAKILISFLIFGLLVGGLSFWLGKETAFFINPVGIEISEVVPNSLYIPCCPLKNLYIPVTLLFWGLIGLIVQLIYNTRKRRKNLPQ